MASSLLEEVAAGRTDAVAACIARYHRPIWNLARRYLGSVHDAEDGVQDVFLQLWKIADRFDPARGSEIGFVLTVARRRLLDATRRRKRGAASLAEAQDVPAAIEPAASESDDETARVFEALAAIEPEQREVLQMSLLQGHSHQQVAERTGLPLGTVKSHARRGLDRVRKLLGVEPGADR